MSAHPGPNPGGDTIFYGPENGFDCSSKPTMEAAGPGIDTRQVHQL